MTKNERSLLKKLAQSLRFIKDVRQLAIDRADATLIKKTAGIDDSIELLSKQYPRVFKRYYNNVAKKVSKSNSRK